MLVTYLHPFFRMYPTHFAWPDEFIMQPIHKLVNFVRENPVPALSRPEVKYFYGEDTTIWAWTVVTHSRNGDRFVSARLKSGTLILVGTIHALGVAA